MSDLSPMLRPQGIAVVGATAAPAKAGAAMMRSLDGYPGPLYPVNPRGGRIGGRPAHPSVSAIGAPVDLAVLVVPPVAVPAALADCGRAGVRAAVVCAGGFAESGPAGEALQRATAETAAAHGIRLLGPNTSGFVNPVERVFANFMPAVVDLRPGPAAIVAQSGGVNLALCFLAAADGLGVRLGVGLGNAVDVGFVEVLDHLAEDPETRVVGLHVEGLADGRAVYAAVARLAARKPVVALKVGRADVGDFAKSHTGALTGSYALTRAALAQAGAVPVDGPTELVDAMRALSARRLPARERPGIAVVTGQAGPGLIVADALRGAGVDLPELGESTVDRLGELLPPLTYQRNPVDTGRPGDTFPQVLATVAADPAVDALVIYALDEPDALDPVAAVRAVDGVPVLFGSGGPAGTLARRGAALGAAGFPLFTAPDRLAAGTRALVADSVARHRAAQPAPPAVPTGRRVGAVPLDEDAAKTLVESAGLRTPARRACATRAEAEAALAALGAPVVVKLLDPAVTHKSDIGGVHVDVRGPDDLHAALSALDRLGTGTPVRYLVERQAPPGPELIVGGVRDAVFGPAVLLAVGGTGVELAPEPILRLAPLRRTDAVEMVRGLPAALLAGYRGAPPVDVGAVADAVLAVAGLLVGHDDIAELDVNPLRLTPDGPIALDALVVPVAPDQKEVIDV